MSKGRILKQEWVSSTFKKTADGCFHLSLNDLLAWERGVRTRAILKPESWSQMFTPFVLKSGKAHPYGFAWGIQRKSGRTVHGHDGSFQGFEAILTRYIEEELTTIALANLADVDLEQVTSIAELIAKNSDAATCALGETAKWSELGGVSGWYRYRQELFPHRGPR